MPRFVAVDVEPPSSHPYIMSDDPRSLTERLCRPHPLHERRTAAHTLASLLAADGKPVQASSQLTRALVELAADAEPGGDFVVVGCVLACIEVETKVEAKIEEHEDENEVETRSTRSPSPTPASTSSPRASLWERLVASPR